MSESQEAETDPASENLIEPIPDEPARPPVTRDGWYYLDFVEFLVEDSLFQVPRFQFDNQPSSFWASIEPIAYDGSAIKLEGIRAADFFALMKLLYPLDLDHSSKPETQDEWKSVLKLSFKWGMRNSFEKAMDALRRVVPLPLHEQALLAKEYGVYEWLQSTYTELVKRDNSLSEYEATSLGLNTALKLVYCREERYERQAGSGTDTQVRMPRYNFDDAITSELQSLKQIGDMGNSLTLVEQVVLGREKRVAKWVESAYEALVDRAQLVSLSEAKVLGIAISMALCKAREKTLRLSFSAQPFSIEADSEAEVMHQFKHELNALNKINAHYGEPPPTPPPPLPPSKPNDMPKRNKKGNRFGAFPPPSTF